MRARLHFSVLKSGGSLTVALDTGTIHTHVEKDIPLIIYTAQIQARAISIGNGPEDNLVGLDASGAMFVRSNQGAVRVEQQFTGQSVLVPQSGDVSLTNGQLESLHTATGQCVCEVMQPLGANHFHRSEPACHSGRVEAETGRKETCATSH